LMASAMPFWTTQVIRATSVRFTNLRLAIFDSLLKIDV
jgi:hypothetical protein